MTDREVKVSLSREERYRLRNVAWAGLLDSGPLESVLGKVAAAAAAVVEEPEDVTVTISLPWRLAEQIEFGARDDIDSRSLWHSVRSALDQWRADVESTPTDGEEADHD